MVWFFSVLKISDSRCLEKLAFQHLQSIIVVAFKLLLSYVMNICVEKYLDQQILINTLVENWYVGREIVAKEHVSNIT